MFRTLVNLNNVAEEVFEINLPTVEDCIDNYLRYCRLDNLKNPIIMLDDTIFEYVDGVITIVGEVDLRQ